MNADRRRRAALGWALAALIVIALALGVLLVTSGLLVPTGDPRIGPTAFTLTPQAEETETSPP